MVIMALDHTRGFFSNAQFNPIDPAETTPAYFFTRWITHYCAPLFVFLAGTGAYLAGTRGMTRLQLSRFLLTRGLWLVVLELTVVRAVWITPVVYDEAFGAVIWAIGWSMVALAILVQFPLSAVAAVGVAIVALHNAFDGVTPADWGRWGWLWKVLHAGGPMRPFEGFTFTAAYPVLPWIGVMACGYAFGALVRLPAAVKREQLLGLGLAMTLLFFGLRGTNLYGDPHPWAVQERGGLYTFFSFLNCEKYPPSLSFLLMTLGPGIEVLSLMRQPLGAAGRALVIYGRVPLFYYVLHFALIHAVAVGLAYSKYGQAGWLFHGTGVKPPTGYGYDLPIVYLIWIGVVVTLYLPCRWFAGVKKRRRDWWLSYL
jgi:uncharacterized membrane protein